MKPSGPVHLGNLVGALRAWVALQHTHETYVFVANWHAYTRPVDPRRVRHDTREAVIDILAAGLDPDRAALFLQSDVKEHAELHVLLSMSTPLAWLERVPGAKDVAAPSYGRLGYPVLMAADILAYRAEVVPVGRDQLAHLELTREIARRFNHAYGAVFPEPQAMLGTTGILPGTDGRKMSKSYGNVIALSDSPDATAKKILSAFTTPTKVRRTDPGQPETCAVCQWRRAVDPDGYAASWEEDRRGVRGCLQNKQELVERLNAYLAPLRARRRELVTNPAEVERILRVGAERARVVAAETLERVREAMALT